MSWEIKREVCASMNNRRKQLSAEDIEPVLLRIQPSPKYSGVGVFALRDIKEGTILCDVEKISKEVFVPWEEFAKIDATTRSFMIDFCAEDKDGFYSPINLNYLTIPGHMNHHCEANVGCDADDNFVAIRDIKKGEETCLDYAFVISNPAYIMKCACDSKKCRGIVTGNDWKNPAFWKKNSNFFSSNVRKFANK